MIGVGWNDLYKLVRVINRAGGIKFGIEMRFTISDAVYY